MRIGCDGRHTATRRRPRAETHGRLSVDPLDDILQSGAKKQKRRDKSLVDKVAAALILEQYMEENYW